MLTSQENERLTRVGPGTPMGELFRRYWIPGALSTDVALPDGPPLRVRLLGEDLIMFRATDGSIGLVDAYCPHRRAPLFFGRNEECGLRCVYHGWKFDRHGECVDMPSEPPDSLFKTKVRLTAYATHESAGVVWIYMGPREDMPAPPDYEFTRAPSTHRHISKTFEECNWLQALEGGLDTSHSSFLHDLNLRDKNFLRNADTAPRLDVEKTDYGFRYAGVRSLKAQQYVRVYHYVMPAQQLRGLVTNYKGEGLVETPAIHGHIWVPIDDVTTFAWNWMYSYDANIPISDEFVEYYETRNGRGADDFGDEPFKPKRNLRNDFLIDREEQKNRTFTGIKGINTQDFAVQQGMGPIVDRSQEHLGTSDRAIIAIRQSLLEALDDVEAGRTPRGVDTGTYANIRAVDLLIPEQATWQEALKDELIARF
jgi:phthalate 4,5-dioxygenase